MRIIIQFIIVSILAFIAFAFVFYSEAKAYQDDKKRQTLKTRLCYKDNSIRNIPFDNHIVIDSGGVMETVVAGDSCLFSIFIHIYDDIGTVNIHDQRSRITNWSFEKYLDGAYGLGSINGGNDRHRGYRVNDLPTIKQVVYDLQNICYLNQ